MNTPINIQVCQYIDTADLCKISPEANDAMRVFFESEIDISFGDANKTLIDIPHFMDVLEDVLDQADLLFDKNGNHHAGFKAIQNKIWPHHETVYINLES